ncbi:MAG: tetratricopeptide repeat protein [Chloroflexota bacterium]
MKTTRIILGLLLVSVILACSSLSELPIPTLPPAETQTPSQTSTPPFTPTFTITPSPLPIAQVDTGERAFVNGDYPAALIHFQTAYRDSSDPVLRAAAKWGEARVYYAQGLYPETLTAIQTLLTEFPESAQVGRAYFIQGLANYNLERYNEAAASWQSYLNVRPGYLDAYTHELRGDALFLALNHSDALTAYTAALQAPRLDDGIFVDLKIADTRAKLGDSETALAVYDGIIARAQDGAIAAQAAYEAGALYQALGRSEEAYAKFQLAIDSYPQYYYAYLSLVKLIDAGVPVDDLTRGLVDYYAGQYDVAIAAFDRYIAANPTHDGTPEYFRALSMRDVGNYQGAVDALTNFTANYPTNPGWEDAWGEKAFIQWFHQGLYPVAAQTLLDFVTTVPNSAVAVDYLFSAGRIYERDNRLDEAALTWARIANEYPGDEQAPTAIFMAGIVQYRQGAYDRALASFNRSLSLAVRPEDLARAYLWIGKSHTKLGDATAAQNAWQQGMTADPDGYYSERVREILTERAPLSPPATSNLTPDLAAERRDADAWVRLTFNLPADTDLSHPGTLAQDARLIRGTEFWALGLFDQAREEFENLREAVSTNPVDSYRLANYLLDLGLYRTAIFAARETLTLAGLDDHDESMMAPPYFSHVRYGLYYRDIVIPEAQTKGFDPLFLFSVIRQESLFEGFVHSTADARGLMQIIPSTGGNLAVELNWPFGYKEEDLYRPIVNVRLGTHYLAKNRDQLNGNLYAALAAYNGGPGNAVAWRNLAGDDPDLFLEIVRFEETRNYIRNISEIYVIYRRLYGQGG